MISAKDALKLTKASDDWNTREILYATLRGKTDCQVFWGRELTDEELQAKRNEYRNLGFKIIREDVITSYGGNNREPETQCPAEYRAIISWDKD